MKLNAVKMGVAVAIAVAVIWIICSVLVWAFPASMMSMSGHMVHGDFSDMTWHMSFGGVFVGLVIWSVASGLTAWIIAAVYNRLV